MNWDWDKLQDKRQRQSGSPLQPDNWGRPRKEPNSEEPSGSSFEPDFNKLRKFRFPAAKLVLLVLFLLWGASGIFIVQPDEVGVVLRFGAYDRVETAGPHYHLPFPIESVYRPKVTQVRRAELGFRNITGSTSLQQGQSRTVANESLMLTGDENIVNVQFTVQYQIKDPVAYLFNVSEPAWTVKNAAEAAMREVIGYSVIDSALTDGKSQIQTDTRDLLQKIMDRYETGISIVAVQMQDVHPPKEVIDAFKDVASAREDRSRIINEAEAYQNEVLPKARGLAAEIENKAEAYKETQIRTAKGESARFLAVLAEYNKAKDVTRKRLYLETMEKVLSNPNLEKVILSDKSAQVVPYLPLERLPKAGAHSVGGAQ